MLGGDLEGREQGILVGRVESWMGRDAGTREGWDVRCPSSEVHGITWAGKDGGRRARCPGVLPRGDPQQGPTGEC